MPKGGFFVVKLINSKAPALAAAPKAGQEALPHGLGLRIIEEIAQKYQGMFSAEADADTFTTVVTIRL